jgi:pilus assembly protein CpaE
MKAAIISPDQQLSDRLQREVSKDAAVRVSRLPHYADALELGRFIRNETPRVIFLDAESSTSPLAAVEAIVAGFPTIQVVAIFRDSNAPQLLPLMRAGVRDCLFVPLAPADVRAVLHRVKETGCHDTPAGDMPEIFSFLPSKPGVGASTVALNTGLAAAIQQQKTLLTDFDFHSGTVRFMLNLAPSNSVWDAAERASELDQDLWGRLIAEVGNLHVLAGSNGPMARPSNVPVRQMAEFWRPRYQAVFVDLSGDLDDCSLEVMRESKEIFLVCTAEGRAQTRSLF